MRALGSLMPSATLAPPRPKLSSDFLEAIRRERILKGFAKAVSGRGYTDSHIAHIVKAAGCARRTFYDTFGSKGEAGLSVLADVCPELASRFQDVDPADSASLLLAVEIACILKSGDTGGALDRAREAESIIRPLADCEVRVPDRSSEEPLNQILPPGRHGLSSEFVRANQRHRILCGLVAAVAEHGYLCTTIAHITRHAAVSRRTFYEQFSSIEDVAAGLLLFACRPTPELLEDVAEKSALGAVAVEVAVGRVADVSKAEAQADETLEALGILTRCIEGASAA